MKGSLYTILFALALGSLCAALLTAAGRFTAPYRKANAEAEQVRNVLAVLGVPFEAKAPPKDLLALFDKTVRREGDAGQERFIYAEGDAVKSVAVPFAGPGLWGPIKGYLALAPDMKTIRGVTFYEQEETPGLGGEIASEGFRNQFIDKTITSADGAPGVRIVRGGGATKTNEVDGITGATMTCDKVQAMLNTAIKALVKERDDDGE